MNRFFTFLIVAFLVLSACATGTGKIDRKLIGSEKEQTEVVEAEGLSAIINNDLLDAKKRSLAEAQKNAVEMTVGVYVNAATRVEKAIMVDQRILAKTNGYIKKYKILTEGSEGNFYRTKIQALVKIEELNKDLTDLGLNASPAPTTSNLRIGVVIQDKIDGVIDQDAISENMLAEKLANLQYKVVETNELALAAKNLKAGDILNNLEQQKIVGEMIKADILVIGKANSAFNTEQGLGGMISYRADISFKVIKIKQAALIYSNAVSSGGVATTKEGAGREALKRVALVAGEDLVRVLDQRLKTFSYITINLTNLANLNQLASVIKGLQAMIEVKNAVTENFSNGAARIRVEADVEKTSAIAAKLSSTVKDVSLKVSSVSTDSIDGEIQ